MKQIWKKIGLVYDPNEDANNQYSYAAVPFVGAIENNLATIYFSSRDKSNKSHLFSIQLNLDNLKIESINKNPILSPGSIGHFDEDGVMPCQLFNTGKEEILYYIGWNKSISVPFRNSIGACIVQGGTIHRKFDGPILDRSIHDPCFVASCHVISHAGIFMMYYLSCLSWDKTEKGLIHKYHIKIATSTDGINWERNGKIAINFEYENEYAISVPRVLNENNLFKMWYSYRGGPFSESYKIGYAESSDGIHWSRKDNLITLVPDVENKDWDHDMECYPFIFDYKGRRLMLYNGNGYGQSGFGIAELLTL